MELKSEKSIKEYLKTLPDDTIIKYYLDVEFSPFPILVMQEYNNRFKRKTKVEIIRDLKLQTRLAKKKTQEFGRMAKSHKLIDDVTKQKSEEVIKQAKRKGYEVSKKLAKKSSNLGSKLRKKTTSSGVKHLELIEKLDSLRKAGIITQKEFQEKKKKILSKI